MTYQKVKSAEVDMDKGSDTYQKILVKNEMGITSTLKTSDIESAIEEIHWNRPVKTLGQKIMFAKALEGKIIDMKNLNGPAKKSLVETAKEARELGKNAKVELLFESEGDISTYDAQVKLVEAWESLKEVEGYSKIKGIPQFKVGEGEGKEKQRTMMFNMDKDYTETLSYAKLELRIIKSILDKIPEYTYLNKEVKTT